jgi:hypothetical protein
MIGLVQFIMGLTYKANEAVTKTDAKPPIPPTKGASPRWKYLPPI